MLRNSLQGYVVDRIINCVMLIELVLRGRKDNAEPDTEELTAALIYWILPVKNEANCTANIQELLTQEGGSKKYVHYCF